MSRLYCLHYKNYYNHQAKRETSVSNYAAYLVPGSSYLSDIDFNPNDGVETYQIIGSAAKPWSYDSPDYVVVTSENGSTIQSRWYVTEAGYTRGNQYRLRLYRDLAADFRSQMLTSPAFIEKAMLNIGDPAIYNSEGISFSQIKKEERLLKDQTQSGWVVGYHSKLNQDINVTIEPNDILVSGVSGTLDGYAYYSYSDIKDISGATVVTSSNKANVYAHEVYPIVKIETASGPNAHAFITQGVGRTFFDETAEASGYHSAKAPAQLVNSVNNAIAPLMGQITSLAKSTLKSAILENLYNEVGKVYKLNNKYYKVSRLIYTNDTRTYQTVSSGNFSSIYSLMANAAIADVTGSANNNTFKLDYKVSRVNLELREIYVNQQTLIIRQTAKALDDAPYCMFCIPYGGRMVVNGTEFNISQEQALNYATSIGVALGTNSFDIQILPYCPRRDWLSSSTIFVGNVGGQQYGTEDIDYFLIKESSTTKAAVIYCATSTFSFSIPYTFNVSNNPTEYKVNLETRFLRFVSPNYNGIFEITPEKNGGISGININCTYKPFSPYIQVAPSFGELYGQDFGDSRGLICAGNWSIAQISDQWVNYELNNINYENSFNRQISSLELQNKYSKKGDILNAISGTVSGTISGASAGALAGGPWGAVAGAVAGGAGAGITGAMDVKVSDRLRADAMDLRKDLFAYDLQNIQARPDSLTKVSAQNAVFKVWPFIEVFEAPEAEKQALRDKIKYDSMTVMRIGRIESYIKPTESFIKGRFIRLEGVNDDAHILSAINSEFQAGVYF